MLDLNLTEEDQKALAALEKDTAAQQNNATYDWDEEYQRQVLALLLRDRHFLVQSYELVKPEYFTSAVHKKICDIIFKSFEQYRVLLNKIQIKQEILDSLKDSNDETKIRFLGELSTVYEYYVPGLDTRQYLLDKVTKFAQIQALRIAFKKSFDEIKKAPESESTWTNIRDLLRNALSVDRNFEIGLEYFQSLEERYARMKENITEGEIFTSGFPAIDNALKGGGLKKGEMGSWVGLSGTGKSLALTCAAIANMNRKKKVLYLSLELDQDSAAQRFDAQLADPSGIKGLDINQLLDQETMIIDALKDYASDCEDPRMLVIKQFPGGSMDVATFRAYFTQSCLNGFRPDLVIIDYVGEMKDYPGMPTWESRYRIVRDLRGLAVEEGICILTAMQPGKAAREAQKLGEIDDDNIADAFGQIRPLDACWSINQNADEKECGVARIFVIKHRDGKSRFTFHVEYNQKTLKISQITQEVYLRRVNEYKNKKAERMAKETVDHLVSGHIAAVDNKNAVVGVASEEPVNDNET